MIDDAIPRDMNTGGVIRGRGALKETTRGRKKPGESYSVREH